ncbi:hypothetical protein WJX72_010123 [[Myrmecia] bisecta]|uniref:Post-GPI attachment to proteins factor 3 n=1 Tax=[Myrmecia] bisecta TaxID=41462 RepID=A0AAW1R935_9CHLO
MLRWSCQADCRYHCMRALESWKAAGCGEPVVKYYGKWPFRRVWGMQEAASVVLSLGNLAAHAHNLVLLLRQQDQLGGGRSSLVRWYYRLWVMYMLLCINSWLWSAVFHARDVPVTERLDYFSVDALVLFSLFLTLLRTHNIRSRWAVVGLGLISVVLYIQHVYHMTYVLFDYGYNMRVCLALGMLQTVLWLYWAHKQQHPARYTLCAFLFLINVAMLLEVLDFAPMESLVDAHALWHACTIPLVYLWYAFAFADLRWLAQADNGGQRSDAKRK